MRVFVLTVASLSVGATILLIGRELSEFKFCLLPSSENVDRDLRMIRSQYPVQWTPDGAHIVFDSVDFYASRQEIPQSRVPLERSIFPLGTYPPESGVYVAAADGSALLPITEGDRRHPIAHSPSISPDGSRIAYSTYEYRKERPSYFEIETSAIDGSDKRSLTKEQGLDFSPVWSPDGTRIAFLRHDKFACSYFKRRGIYTMKADGSDVRMIAPVEDPMHARRLVESLAWSPDGQTLAFFIEEEVWVSDDPYFRRTSIDLLKADGSERTRLVAGKERYIERGRYDPSEFEFLETLAWSADSQRIAFIRLDDDRRAALYTIGKDGAGGRPLAYLGTFEDWGTRETYSARVIWSVDGSQITLLIGRSLRDVPHSYMLYMVDTDGSDLQGLEGGFHGTVSATARGSLTLSPDGSRVAVVVPGGQDVVLYTVIPGISDVRALVRRGDDGSLRVVSQGQ